MKKNDIVGKFFWLLFFKRMDVVKSFCSPFLWVLLRLKGVEIKKGCLFFGLPKFVRHPFSQIIISDNCSLRSSRNSNLIGINRPCIFSTHGKNAVIRIGKNSGFSGTVIGALERIEIGSNVLCGANTLITDFDWHDLDPEKRMSSKGRAKPIIINDNVFIGYGSTILKGVTIGKNSIVGANSTVTRDIPDNCIAAGNPAIVLKKLANLSE